MGPAQRMSAIEGKTDLSGPPVPKIVFIEPDGRQREVEAPVGATVLEIAHEHDLDLEGACEGSMACSTCHVIVDPADFPKLARPSVEEEDMLEFAFGLCPTSRLGCQIVITEEMDGLRLQLPGGSNNMLLG